jgi:hypothetical protein
VLIESSVEYTGLGLYITGGGSDNGLNGTFIFDEQFFYYVCYF